MKNTIFFDSDFKFTLLENEENPDNSIYIKFHTSDAANQVLNILANGNTITESLASDDDIEYELEQTNWTDNGATVIWLTNDDISSPKVKIIFSLIPTKSCAINRGTDTVFLMQYEGQEEESGSGSGGGSVSGGFDFVETIRNIGFRLLDEPSNTSIIFNIELNQIEIKWTDPTDINTLAPVPCTWAGTVVVRKSGSAPLHKWDGEIIADSTTRNEYSVNPLIDENITAYAQYYYGIFPYYIAIDDISNPIKYYRYTKILNISAEEQQVFDFEYSGNVEEFIAPSDGFYLLEAWGAQGGKGKGMGGYSVGKIQLTQNDTLYICVGGQGQGQSGSTGGQGGYNGGGNGGDGYTGGMGYVGGGGGGGATHIAKTNNRGVLANYDEHREEIIIVAGGGGGNYFDVWDNNRTPGAGGGFEGAKGNLYNYLTNGGTQNSGYAFGQGENGMSKTDSSASSAEGNCGGGGGWYGGRGNDAGGSKIDRLGAGGSGYINTTILTEAYMYGFNVPTSPNTETKTYTTTAHSATPTKDIPKEGNGHARIKYLGR